MSLYDYQRSSELELADEPFYALIQAAIRRADTDNLARLRDAFPETYNELLRRYHAPGGRLPGEE